jgi:multidrug efflux pump
MLLSDISVKRPVFATTLSLLIVALGVMSFLRLPLREIPDIDPPIVSVDTTYRGASAAVIESRITQVIEDAVAGIEGIETVQSSSQSGRGSVTVEFRVGRDIDAAANDVRDAVARARNRLPLEADPPQVAKVDGDADVMMWINLSSENMTSLELSDYAERFLVDQLSTVDGVARINIGGGERYAMQIQLKREELAARGLAVTDVINALQRENIELPAGQIESTERDFIVRVPRSYTEASEFNTLTLSKGSDGHVVKLGEVADIELASSERRTYFTGNGVPQVGLGVIKTSNSNTLDVANGVRAQIDRMQGSLPTGTSMFIAVDTSEFIKAAVDEVYFTLGLTMVLVIVVIWLFLGSWRAALIPAVTVPVCVIASFIALAAFGFSLNLLTLLALILSIGLVVDDAIVVLENCQRRVDEGETPLVAAYRGARQVGFAVMATTAVLVAVFLPIAFMEGNLGRLFRELAAAIAASVAISAVVALSLSPMMCSRLLRRGDSTRGMAGWIERQSQRLTAAYRRLLDRTVDHWIVSGALMVGSVIGIMFLLQAVPSELAPAEDRGVFFVRMSGPEGAGFDYTLPQVQQVERKLLELVENGDVLRINMRAPAGFGGGGGNMHTGQAIVVMKPWNERTESTDTVIGKVQKLLAEVPGLSGFPQMRQGLVRSFGQPLQFVLLGSEYDELARWRDLLLPKLAENEKLQNIDADYKETQPQLRVNIDRERAADLGVSVQEIATTLDTMLGSRRTTTFIKGGEEYDVLVQAQRSDRSSSADLSNLYVRSRSGQLVPLANLVTVSELAEAASFNRFNRLRAITISARPLPGYPLGDAIRYVEDAAREVLPDSAVWDYKGDSRELQRSGGGFMLTFALAMLVVFLVLAAQFESFLHPLIIMLTVPLAVLGALIGLLIAGSTLNLYSQIGIVMLVGLAAKNGILIVEFANQLRDLGRNVREAVIEAAGVRLRPIIMTSVCTIVGALPLVFAHGAGAMSRFTIGVVIVTGVALSTLLSLFIVPAVYTVVARYTRSPEAVSRELEAQERQQPDAAEHAAV